MLRIENVTIGYSHSSVVHNLSISLAEKSRTALLGANGAGKSTLLKTVSGFLRCREGDIWFDGERISRLAPSQIVRRGVIHVPEGRRVFSSMTVLENLQAAGHFYAQHRSRRVDAVMETFPQLKGKLGSSASLLSGGEQQMLAIGRAMMHEPRLLLLDEVSLGLSPVAAETVYRSLDSVFRNLTVLVVEQSAKLALEHCSYVFVMRNGIVASQGASEMYRDAEVLRSAYLGDSAQ